MRKLMAAFVCTSAYIVMMYTPVLAEEVMQDEMSAEEAQSIDCTMLYFAPQENRNSNGSFMVGKPITLELSVPKAGEMETYFMLLPIDAVDPVPLNDGTSYTIDWVPEKPNTYTVFGEFVNSSTGEYVRVEDPDKCAVVLEVEKSSTNSAEPSTLVTEASTTTTQPPPVKIECSDTPGSHVVITEDGAICSVRSDHSHDGQPIPPAVTGTNELAQTGMDTTIAIVGLLLVAFGALMNFGSRRHAKRLQ